MLHSSLFFPLSSVRREVAVRPSQAPRRPERLVQEILPVPQTLHTCTHDDAQAAPQKNDSGEGAPRQSEGLNENVSTARTAKVPSIARNGSTTSHLRSFS